MTILDKERLSELRNFVELIEKQPELLKSPELSFFRAYLEKLGAKIQVPSAKDSSKGKTSTSGFGSSKDVEEIRISDDEPDTEDENDGGSKAATGKNSDDPDLIPAETNAMPPLASEEPTELSEAQEEMISEHKKSAAEAIENGKLDEALDHLTKIIQLAPPSALLYSKRADVLLKLRRPMACIRDCDEAIRLNPDSGKSYRIRGKAYRALGDWKNAHCDLELGQRIDYDENIYEVQKYVAEKWKLIDTENRSKQRRREDRHKRNMLRQRRRRQEQARKEYAAQKAQDLQADEAVDDDEEDDDDDVPHSFNPGTMPGGTMPSGTMPSGSMPGCPGGMDSSGLGGLLGGLGGLMGNPSVKKAMENPRVLQAVLECMQNPAAAMKYQNDPDVMSVMAGLMSAGKASNPGGARTSPPGS